MVSARVENPYFFTLYLRLAELIKNRNIKSRVKKSPFLIL